MSVLYITIWAAVGALSVYMIEVLASLIRHPGLAGSFKKYFAAVFPIAIEHAVRVYAGVLLCIGINAATPHLSIPATIMIGGAGPALIFELARLFVKPNRKNETRDKEISDDAELLNKARKVYSYQVSQYGISDDLTEILAARRRELADDLPVVDPSGKEETAK